MKSKFLAGLIASLVTFALIVSISIAMVLLFDMDSKSKLVYVIAFVAIAIWKLLYTFLKPKDVDTTSNQK
jgi:hypothetical protein